MSRINKLINFTGAGAEELAAQSIANDAWGYVVFWGFIEAGVATVDAAVTNGAYLKADGTLGQLTLAGGNMFDGDEAPRGTLAIAYTTDASSAFQPMIFMLGYTVTKPLNKYDATTAPAVTDDAGDGYSVNSLWTDTTADVSYICQDATVGAAVWLQLGSVPYIFIRDEKAVNVAGGSFTAGAWRTRDLNTESSDVDGLVAIASNQFTLAAGTYVIAARAPAKKVDGHKLKLYNATGASDIIIGSHIRAANADNTSNDAWVHGRFVIAASQALEIQHRGLSTQATDGLGQAANLVEIEVYTEVQLWKVG